MGGQSRSDPDRLAVRTTSVRMNEDSVLCSVMHFARDRIGSSLDPHDRGKNNSRIRGIVIFTCDRSRGTKSQLVLPSRNKYRSQSRSTVSNVEDAEIAREYGRGGER